MKTSSDRTVDTPLPYTADGGLAIARRAKPSVVRARASRVETTEIRPGQERRSWRPTRSLAPEGGRGAMSRLSPLIGHFIGRVLRDTRHRLCRQRRLYAGKVP